MEILNYLAFFVTGMAVMFLLFEHFIRQPLEKAYIEAMKGWQETLKIFLDSSIIKKVDETKDGSVKSPLQIL